MDSDLSQAKASFSTRRFLGKIEAFLGCWGAGLLIGICTLVAAAIYVTPALHCVNHGCTYEELSSAPFAFASDNVMKSRLLTAALAYLIFLKGRLFIVFPLLLSVLLLASIYWFHRRRLKFASVSALLIVLVIAFSTPLLFLLHFQGYTDVTSYLLIFLAMQLMDTRFAQFWPVLFGLAILNHESSTFVAPFLLVLSWSKRGWRFPLLDCATLGLCLLGAFGLFRHIHLQGNAGFSLPFYLSTGHVNYILGHTLKMLPIGIFMAFKLFWCLPLMASAVLFKRKDYKTCALVLLPIPCALGQLLIADDTSRLLGLAFPSMLLAGAVLHRAWGEGAFSKRLLSLFLWNLLVPQYYVGQEIAVPMLPLPISLFSWLCFGTNPWALWWT
jgi:hypothetical protein